jgi:dolichol-phosphate mannosyltransferase
MAVALSIVITVKDEEENVAPVARELAEVLRGEGEDAEILFVDDGSTDQTLPRLLALKAELPNLRVLSHAVNADKSRAVRTGVRAARAEIVVTMDGDGQNDPRDIARLLPPLRADTSGRLGMVAGVRIDRNDTESKRRASRMANGIRRWLLKDTATDTGCGLKAMRREAYLALPFFDHQHRYLITLMQREGYEVAFVDVNDRARLHGRSKYSNLQRALVGVFDLLGVRWLQRRYQGGGFDTVEH